MDAFFALLALAALAAFVLGPIGFVLALGARRRLSAAEQRLRELAMEIDLASRGAAAPLARPTTAREATPTAPAAASDAPEPASSAPPESVGLGLPRVAASDGTQAGAAPGASPEPPRAPSSPADGDDAPLVGSAHSRAPRPGLEERIGARWSVLIGGLALALGALLLVKYSFEAGLFGPAARVLAGLGLGAALVFAGEVLRRRDRASGATPVSIPAALTAAGTVATFGALYAAHAIYGFIGPTPAFLLLGATGVAAMLAAALHGPALAGVGLVGALAAPMLVSSDRPNPWPLLLYLVIVSATAMGLARLRRWLWLALAALVGAGVWQFLLIDLSTARGGFDAAPLHGLAQTALALAAFIWPLRGETPTRPALVATLAPTAMALLTLGALAARPAAQFGASWILVALALVALLGLAGRAVAAGALLAPLAALAGLAAMMLWPSADVTDLAARARIGWAILLAPPVDPGLFTAFATLALLGLTALSVQRLRDVAPAPAFAAAIWAATAAAAPLAGLALSYARIGGWDINYPFAALAGLLALAFVVLAGMFRPEAGSRVAARLALGFFAAGAIAALALGLVFVLSGGMLTVALALAALGAALVAARLDIDALRWMVAALGLVIAARLAIEPRIVVDPGTTPIFNWLLFGYGAPALAFGLAARLMRRTPDDAPLRIAQALALVFLALLVFFEIRHGLNGGDIYAREARLAEAGLQTFSALCLAVATVLIGGRDPPLVWRLAPILAGGLSLAAALFGLALAANPLFSGRPLAGGVAFNELLPGYGLPAAAAIVLAIVARGRRSAWFLAAAATLALALVFAYATLETRRVFAGPQLAVARGASEAEVYAYSAVWLALGLVTLAWGVIRRSREARLGSAVFVLAATLKIFLYDFSGLEGALRAFSFIGLGLVLIGIGRVYQKLVFARPAAAPSAAEP